MNKLFLFPLVIFLISFISLPVLAYFPITINTTANYGTDKTLTGFACINATDNNVYCFVKTYAGAIYRYNSTWNLLDSCLAGDTTGTFYMTNESYAYVSVGATCNVYNLTNISAGGSCTLQTSYASGLCGASHNTYVSAISNGKVYTSDRILNPSGSYAAPIFWESDLYTEMNAPDKNDNTTFFVAKTSYSSTHQDFLKYTSGTFDGYIQDPFTLWGIGEGYGKGVYVSMQKTNGITWAYIVDINTNSLESAETDYLYKVNFSQALSSTSSIVTAISPLNSTYSIPYDSTSYVLNANLSTSNSGTLYFYFDDSLVGIVTVNASNINSGQFSWSVPINTTTLNHHWYAKYTDNISTSWSFSNIYFTLSAQPSNVGDWFAVAIGSIFGISDIPLSRNIAGLLLTPIISLLLVMFLAIYTKEKQINIMQPFVILIIFFLVFFTAISWINPLFMVVLLILTAGLMVKFGQGLFGGGH